MEKKPNETIELMRCMKLPAMADEYENQLNDTKWQNSSFDERLYHLLNIENNSRINHTIAKNIKAAKLTISQADFIDLNKDPDRQLQLDLIESLKDNNYIDNGLNITIIGATGTGKSWLANAFANKACKEKYKVRYYRLTELLSDLEAARIQNKYRQTIIKISRYDLLIIDDFLLTETNTIERNDILEILEYRVNRKSTIFASQFSPEGWHNKLGKGSVADAILDRITNSSYTIFLQGKSLRETYSKIK